MNSKEKVLIHRGMDLVKRAQYQEALEVFDRLLDMNSSIPEAWNNRGVALFGMGRTDEALESYDRTLTLDPSNLEALRNRGFVLRNTGRLAEALQCYQEVLLSPGADAFDHEAMAAVLAGMDMLEEAQEELLKAIEITRVERFENELEVLQSLIQQRAGNSPQGKE
jgi:tetratricopeptide (TPR) repeat protein